MLHDKATSPELGELLTRLGEHDHGGELSAWERAVVRDAQRDYRKRTAVPKALAQREAALGTEGYQAWAKARAENDFKAYAPVLQEWLELIRERSAVVAPGVPAYDAVSP